MRKIIVLITCLTLAFSCQKKEKEKTKKHNVVFVYIDDLRPELNCYGKSMIKSPNIDKLANEGVLFERAYVQNPVCGASRASIFTGLRPNKFRFKDYKSEMEVDAPGITTLPQLFKENGYYTVSNGKVIHSIKDTEKRSWSEPAWQSKLNTRKPLDPDAALLIGGTRKRGPFFESPDVPDEAYTDGDMINKSIKDLKRLSEMDQPFFLAVGIKKPHLPFYVPKKYWDLYDRNSIEIARNNYLPANAPEGLIGSPEIGFYHNGNIEYNSEEFHKVARHGYYASVSYADTLFGKLLDEIEALGLKDNTIIILIGDHGWNLGEHTFWSKHNTTHLAMNAPMIISAPGYKTNQKSNALVEFIDIYPTLCELTGIELPKHLEGTSFELLLDNPKQTFKKKVYSRHKKAVTVVSDRYTFTRFSGKNPLETMLFDLKNDPDENINIAQDTLYKNIVQQMNRSLDSTGVYSSFYDEK